MKKGYAIAFAMQKHIGNQVQTRAFVAFVTDCNSYEEALGKTFVDASVDSWVVSSTAHLEIDMELECR